MKTLGTSGISIATTIVQDLNLPITPLEYRAQVNEVLGQKLQSAEFKPGTNLCN